MAIITVFLQGLQMFSDLGTGPAIVQHANGPTDRFRNTAWSLQIIRGCTLCAVCGVLAVPASTIYDTRLLSLLPIAGLSALIAGLASTATHTLNRQLILGQVIVNETSAQIAGGVVGIALAITAPSVWALVAATLTTACFNTVLSYRLPGPDHRFLIDKGCMREQLQFGKWITLSSACTFLGSGSDRLILGKLVDAGTLGIYNNALNLGQIPIQLMQAVGSRVFFPLLAAARRDGTMELTFHRTRSTLLAAGGIVTGGMIIAGPVIVPIMFGPKSAEAGWMVQFIACGIWFQILESINSKVPLASGDTKWIAIGTLSRFAVIASLLPIAYSLGGLTAVLLCIAMSDVPRYFVSVVGAAKSGIVVLGRDLRDTLILSITIAIGLSIAGTMHEKPHQLQTALGVIVFCALWLGTRIRVARNVYTLIAARITARAATG